MAPSACLSRHIPAGPGSPTTRLLTPKLVPQSQPQDPMLPDKHQAVGQTQRKWVWERLPRPTSLLYPVSPWQGPYYPPSPPSFLPRNKQHLPSLAHASLASRQASSSWLKLLYPDEERTRGPCLQVEVLEAGSSKVRQN